MTILDTKKLNKLWSKSADLQNPLRERHMFDLAFFLWSNRQFDESVAVSGTLIELLAERPGESLWIDALHLQSMALHDVKRDEEAIESELKALEYAETLEPASERAFMHWHLADCYRTIERPELQEIEYLKAIDAFKESDNEYYLGQAYIDLANLHYISRRYDQSSNYFKLAVPVLEKTQRTDKMPYVKYRLAGVERIIGHPQLALQFAEEALILAKFTSDSMAERETLIEFAQIQVELGNEELAISILDSVVADNDEITKNRSSAKAMYYKAKALDKIGKSFEARELYEASIPLLEAVNLDDLSVNARLSIIHSPSDGAPKSTTWRLGKNQL